jgi:flavin-dependent dehydrogenase
LLSSPVRSIAVEDNCVEVEVTRGKESLHFEARAVVVATGFGSKLVKKLGLGVVGDFAMGAQADVETIGLNEVELYFGKEVAPGFFAWLVPTSSSEALVGLLSRRKTGFYLRRLISSLVAQKKIVTNEAELSYRAIPLKPLARTYNDRLIVVGDAAGQVKPTTGGGIYYGLLCADIAADSLQQALNNNDLSAKNLAGYEREWKNKLGRELKVCYYGRKFFERLSDRQIDQAFDIIKSNGIVEAMLKAEDLSFDWHGKSIIRLLGYRALSKVIKVMKMPFQIGVN